MVAIEITAEDPVLDGHGPSRRVEYEAQFSGTLHVWTRSKLDVELVLRAEDTSGVPVAGEDGFGGKMPHIQMHVEPGRKLSILAALAQEGVDRAGVSFEVHVVAAPETQATRDVALAARDAMAEIKTLLANGDLAHARSLAEQMIDELYAAAGARTSEEVASVATEMLEANSDALSLVVPARHAFSALYSHFSRTLPDAHPKLQVARLNLATALSELGNLAAARELQERALEIQSLTLRDDSFELQQSRENLAQTLQSLGDVAGTKALRQKVLEVLARTLPDDHPALQEARNALGSTLRRLGDLAGARGLLEKALEVQSRTLPNDHPDLQLTRLELGATLHKLGDLAGARVLWESVLEVRERTLPEEDFDLQAARSNLAMLIEKQGDFAGARALEEKALGVLSRTLIDEDPRLQTLRQNMAATLMADLARRRRASEKEGAGASNDSERERCLELMSAVCRARLGAARSAILQSPAREAEERCASLAHSLGVCLTFALGGCVLEPLVELEQATFVLAETSRGAALTAVELTRRATNAPEYRALRDDLHAASDELAALARKGTTSAEFNRARVKRETLERALIARAREAFGSNQSNLDFDVEALASKLASDEGAVGFTCFTNRCWATSGEIHASGQPKVRDNPCESLCAFVVRRRGSGAKLDRDTGARRDFPETTTLSLVNLGPIAPIEEAVRAWREALGVADESRGLSATARAESASRVRAIGERLRQQMLDPLLPALAGARRIIVVLDGVLHVVPLDALPLDSSLVHDGSKTHELVGDRWRIETRATLTELLIDQPVPTGTSLIALGNASFSAVPVGVANLDTSNERAASSKNRESSRPGGTEEDAFGIQQHASAHVTSSLRGTVWENGFAPLTHTSDEARGVGALYTNASGSEGLARVLEQREASREALRELAPQARWLHIATHGWFAPESVVSWRDPEPLDKHTGLGARESGAEQMKGMSPMLLCGLALAGANLPEDAAGGAPGLITAEELSMLDLSGCELAVLSACETNVGVQRAGQGVASLQRALQMAGARSVITSLWRVPDEATKELMLDFYRRMWIEKKPKNQALWEAKKMLRDAKDERGEPRYDVRDWAAWVLTGDPN